MDLGEGDGVHLEHAEGQPAAVASDAREPGAPTQDDPAPRTRRKRKAKGKRRRSSAPRAVAPAEGDARAAAAAAELAERAAEAPAEPAGAPEGLEGEPLEALEPDPFDPLELAPHTAPVIRAAFSAAALLLRRRGMARAAESVHAKAAAFGESLSGTLGLRLAAALGPKVAILAAVAEIAEPFIADAWDAAGKAAQR